MFHLDFLFIKNPENVSQFPQTVLNTTIFNTDENMLASKSAWFQKDHLTGINYILKYSKME